MGLINNNLGLPQYCRHLGGIDECGMWGVHYEGQESVACGVIWTLAQRRLLLQYLAQAQGMVETKIEYPLLPKWVTDPNAPYGTPHARRTHGTSYVLMHTHWKQILLAGIPVETLLQSGATVDYTDEPAVIGPIDVPTGITLEDIVVTHPNTKTPIEFDKDLSSISIIYDQAYLFIPRCRLVRTDHANNPPEGWDFGDDNNFETTVDVWTVTSDPSTQGTLVWPSGKPFVKELREQTGTAAIILLNPVHGYVKIIPGSYNGTDWVRDNTCIGCRAVAPFVRLSYKAGLEEMPVLGMDAVIRLAHSMMPEGPCGCDIATLHWQRDRKVPDYVAPERMRVPWGFSDGAWAAWQWAAQLETEWLGVM